jgi:twinkle protein
VNDALQKYGDKHPNVIQKIYDTAQWLDIDGVFTLDELPPVAEATVYDIDTPGFNEHMKLRLGDFSVVTGIPGMGKSTFVNDVMARVATKHRLKIAFASFEQHPKLDHLRNLRKWYHGRNRNKTQADADKWISERFLFIYPSDKQQMEEMIDLDWFLEKASVAVIQHGAQVIIVDPWNELEHKTGRRESLTEYVGRAIRRLKAFAKSNNVHLMVVAHPAKMYRDKSGNFPTPSLYDISDSAHWANKADLGIVVHRENYDSSETIIANRKSRYHDTIGRPGQVKFFFNKEMNTFECCEE